MSLSGLVSHFTTAAMITLSAILTACAGGDNPDTLTGKKKQGAAETISGVEFEKIQNSWLVSVKALSEIESGNHFRIEFEVSPGGSLIFSTNGLVDASGTAIDRGIEFEFRRSSDPTAPELSVIGRASGRESNWSLYFDKIDARGPISLGVDVHNDEGDQAHLIVWSNSSGVRANDRPIFESSWGNVGGAPGRGFGTRWGFKPQDSKVVSVAIESPRDDH